MIIRTEQWKHIPVLHIVEESKEQERVPVVMFFHGFNSAKEHNLHYAYNLARRGMRVILPEAMLHGERSESMDSFHLSLRFWEVVLTSIQEADVLYKELQERNLVDEQTKIGMGGTSMGGITTFGCLASYDWIDTASVMMGSPAFVRLATGQIAYAERGGQELPITPAERQKLFDALERVDLSKNPSRLNQRPLFMWHGEQDTLVPFEFTKEFYTDIQQQYNGNPERLRWMAEEEAGHAVSRPGMLTAVDWLAQHLIAR
ncbi:prolyl oligopeptidase family serine peptidase [Sporosarcina sp. GW1-11]|uniref:prolyl oligopeptidase family serine peptidase n=1 Tax=Sporosarcina sp. GW1-11 TaxID=2899126 RepID=UPI00294D786E|nr:prolyl oligopeptidase family serine peptidase [Sporosarcina sp. GW1-11]MDV6376921.1 prolyl oligopeptidase family serine peptidase [Sporosarcina sp. GW1-11]